MAYWRTDTVTVWLYAFKLLWIKRLWHLQAYRQKTANFFCIPQSFDRRREFHFPPVLTIVLKRER